MKNISIILSVLVLTALLIYNERHLKKPDQYPREGCVFCHKEVSDPDPSHPISAFGCQGCHLGNPYSIDEKRAHLTVVKNPGDLREADRTCGRTGCHPEVLPRVRNSIMGTNRGILRTIQLQWEKIDGSAVDVEKLMSENPPDNLAIEHFRKMCGGCHLWKKRGDFPGEKGRRGGGCSDCHILDERERKGLNPGAFTHARITTRIPSENCVKCHNRSARIGLSYFGRFESAGYGTPYEGMGLSGRRLSGHRFFIQLQADVHYSKTGMECIDCHTGIGIMGDGNRYDQMEDQLDISCEACHSPNFSKISDRDSLAGRLSFVNKRVPDVLGKQVGMTKKGTPLYNLQKNGKQTTFFRKRDGHPIEMETLSQHKAYHNMPGHERLSCQACHSSWIPQCYGCHLTYRKNKSQRDWLSRKETPGLWRETRSYIRFARPTLGLKNASAISTFSPCQVFVSFLDEGDHYRADLSFHVLTMSSFDPHTTIKTSRTCYDCHGDPKSLGLGEGRLYIREGKGNFKPTYDALSSGLGIPFPMDAFVSLSGEALHATSRKDARPFNKDEMHSILSLNACLGCHDRYEDRIYQDFQLSKKRFNEEADLPCRK